MRYLLLSEDGMTDSSTTSEAEAAGVVYLAGGVEPAARATHLTVDDARRTVTGGPSGLDDGADRLVDFAILDVASRAEAVEWAGRFAAASGGRHIEIRRVVLHDERLSAADRRAD